MNLDLVTDIPGILSAFTFDEDKGITAQLLADAHRELDLDAVGRVCARLWAMVGDEPVKNLRFAFDSVIITARKAPPGTLLVTLSDPSAKEEALRANLDRHLGAGSRAKISQADIDEQMQSGPVAVALKDLSATLFQCVGPVAKVIFRDAVREWMGAGPPAGERLQDLIDILVREIKNTEKSQEYLSRLPGYLTTS